MQHVEEDIFSKILEKSIYEKARDKMKQSQVKKEESGESNKTNDYLAPILKKLSLEDKNDLDEEAAIHVKNEALKNLKERLLTRAEIIQKRLVEEQRKLEQAFKSMKRSGEAMSKEDEEKYDNEIHKANFRIDILTERASQHYRTSLRKFTELDDLLSSDPRLKVINKGRA
jgi:hydroxylamine reductase (hybrid-cluster protein)